MPQQAEYKLIQGGPQKIDKEIRLWAAQGFRPILMTSIGTNMSDLTIFIVLERIPGSRAEDRF